MRAAHTGAQESGRLQKMEFEQAMNRKGELGEYTQRFESKT